MSQLLGAIFQIAAFLLFQTVLLNLVGESKYEKYIRTFSGFLLILLLFSAIRSLWDGTDLLAEVEKQVDFAGKEEDFKLQLRQAEESQQEQLKQGYEAKILEEAERYLREERYFLAEGKVTFTPEWALSELYLVISRTWEEWEKGEEGSEASFYEDRYDNGKREGGNDDYDSDDYDMVTEIWIEPVKSVEPVESIESADSTKSLKEAESTGTGNADPERARTESTETEMTEGSRKDEIEETEATKSPEAQQKEESIDSELAALQSRLARQFGVKSDCIHLEWKGR